MPKHRAFVAGQKFEERRPLLRVYLIVVPNR